MSKLFYKNMKYLRGVKEYARKKPLQILLIVVVITAMIEFISVSLIAYSTLKRAHIEGNIIETSITRLIIINISMIILFIFAIFLITKIFKKINNYAFFSCTTGLPNKNFVLNNLIREISKTNKFAALISLDMDNFKAVNDTLGHLSGDELLRQAGKRFKRIIKYQDCICHIGGDEFLFYIKSCKDKDELEIMAKEIIDTFNKRFIINGENIDYLTASLGIALIPQDGNDFQTIYNCADDAMYNAKNFGKNNYKFFDKNMSLHIYEESVKKREIEEGIRKREFKVFYQPKISNEGKLIGAEALVRWFKGGDRILPPSEFIDFAEKKGLIISISEIVIDEVCNKLILWIEKGLKNFTISINITGEQLINERLCQGTIERIKDFNVPPQYIEFEITESMIIKDFDVAINNIRLMKDYGFKISMDDFGTGYSSLNYLKRLPIDIIKIDKSFIDTISEEEKDKIILENIINIAHSFKYEVVAEGVENKNQYDILKKMNCDIFQGYYFGRPIDEAAFEGILSDSLGMCSIKS